MEGDDDAWGFNIGFMFDITEQTRIGLAYRSSIDYDVKGTIAFSAPAASNPVGAGIIAAASASGAPLSAGPVSVSLEVPESALLSLRQKLGERFELLADVAWTGWSSIPELRVVRDSGEVASVTPELWDDVWRFALGGTYTLNQQWMLRAGVAYDETPVPDSTRTPRLPDPDRTWVAIGARWQPSQAVSFDTGYAHLFSDDVPLNQNAGSTAQSALIAGDQSADIDIIGVQFGYRF